MRLLLFLSILIWSTPVLAQTDSSNAQITFNKSFTTLTRAHLEPLPAASFMDMLQRAFPFVSDESVTTDYTFVVNGMILMNPDAINPSQIESIRFYPASTAVIGGSLTKKGSFFISTIPSKSRFSISTKTGLQIGANPTTGSTVYNSKNGLYSFNELGYQHKGNNSFLSSALSYLKEKDPNYTINHTNNIQHAQSADKRIRLSNFAGYQFNPFLKIEGGLLYTRQTLKATSDQSQYINPTYAHQQSSEQKEQHAGAYTNLLFTPSAKFTNRFSIEGFYKTFEQDDALHSSWQNFSDQTRIYQLHDTTKGYAFANEATWLALQSPVYKLQFSLTTRYRKQWGIVKDSTAGISNGQVNNFWSRVETANKSFSLTPVVHLAIKQWIKAEAGLVHDTYGSSWYGENSDKKALPHGGLLLELASLIKGKAITSLEFSSHYSKYLTSFEQTRGIGTQFRNAPNSPFLTFSEYGAYEPLKNWVSSASITFGEERLALKVSYREYERMIRVSMSVPVWVNPGGITMFLEKLPSKSWSAEVKTAIINKPQKSWNLSGMVYRDKYEPKLYGGGQMATPVGFTFYDAGKVPWKGSIRTSLQLNRFFFQGSAFFAFNEMDVDGNGATIDDSNQFSTDFLLAGYNFPMARNSTKQLTINVQSRNLWGGYRDLLPKYVGLGIQMQF